MATPNIPLWEVFIRSKQGLEHTHCGIDSCNNWIDFQYLIITENSHKLTFHRKKKTPANRGLP